jgi:hypothetical protein
MVRFKGGKRGMGKGGKGFRVGKRVTINAGKKGKGQGWQSG